jgi:hypothetical protein
MSKLKLVVYAGMALFLVALMLMGCWRSGGVPGAGAPADRVNITPEVSISHLPKLYEPFTVTGKFRAAEKDEEDAEVWIAVKGAVYLDGEDRWHGPLKKGEEKVLSARFAMVTEGNCEILAMAEKQGRLGRTYSTVQLSVTTQGGELGWRDTDGGVFSYGKDYLPFLMRGATLVTDTALALNNQPTSQVEILKEPADIVRLQTEGLSPTDLRYQWREIVARDYFSKGMLIAAFDVLRPNPRCLLAMTSPRLLSQEDAFRAEYALHCVPSDVTTAAKRVSSFEVVAVGKQINLWGSTQPQLLEGLRTFEFILNDEFVVRRIAEFPFEAIGGQ